MKTENLGEEAGSLGEEAGDLGQEAGLGFPLCYSISPGDSDPPSIALPSED